MQIVVCIKQVIDPEITPRYFQIDPKTNRPVDGDADLVMDSYAENALEMAIQLRDQIPGATVTALCLGDEESEEVLRRALAFTANTAVRIWDEEWENLDGQAVGHILARSIKALGGADLILTGYQASDIEEGLVGAVIAEELGISCVTLVSDIEVEGADVKATCEIDDGHAIIQVSTPALLTIVSSEKYVPRLPKVKDIRLARSKAITDLDPLDIDLHTEKCQPAVVLEHVFVPNRDVSCEMITGIDGLEQAEALTEKLLALKVL